MAKTVRGVFKSEKKSLHPWLNYSVFSKSKKHVFYVLLFMFSVLGVLQTSKYVICQKRLEHRNFSIYQSLHNEHIVHIVIRFHSLRQLT